MPQSEYIVYHDPGIRKIPGTHDPNIFPSITQDSPEHGLIKEDRIPG